MTSLRHVPAPAAFFGANVRPLIVDSNVLIRDIVRSVRKGHTAGLVDCATDLCVFAAQEVLGEIEKRLPQAAATMKVSPDAAISAFRTQYLPRIRWVEVPSTGVIDDPRLNALSLRDPSDLPTALLTILTGVKALSDDPDLVECGLAIGDAWLDPILGVRSLNRTDTLGRFALGGSLELAAATGRVAARMSPRQRLLVLGLVGLLGGASMLRPTTRSWVKRNASGWLSATEPFRSLMGDGLAAIAAERVESESRVQTLIVESDSGEPIYQVMRTLISLPSPMTYVDLCARLSHLSAHDIQRALGFSMFVHQGAGWQVGRLFDARI